MFCVCLIFCEDGWLCGSTIFAEDDLPGMPTPATLMEFDLLGGLGYPLGGGPRQGPPGSKMVIFPENFWVTECAVGVHVEDHFFQPRGYIRIGQKCDFCVHRQHIPWPKNSPRGQIFGRWGIFGQKWSNLTPVGSPMTVGQILAETHIFVPHRDHRSCIHDMCWKIFTWHKNIFHHQQKNFSLIKKILYDIKKNFQWSTKKYFSSKNIFQWSTKKYFSLTTKFSLTNIFQKNIFWWTRHFCKMSHFVKMCVGGPRQKCGSDPRKKYTFDPPKHPLKKGVK